MSHVADVTAWKHEQLKFEFLHVTFAISNYFRIHETERMDFKNVNLLNSRVNILSGNLLPVGADNSQFSVIERTHSAAVWLVELIHTIALIFGIVLSPKKGLKDGTVTVEASFMLTCLYSRKKLVEEMIQKK